jgi:hypothetical protein
MNVGWTQELGFIYGLSMLHPCYIHAISMLYPCYIHATPLAYAINTEATSIPGQCTIVARITFYK